MIYEESYMECKAQDFALLDRRKPKNGVQVQNWLIDDTDDSALSERERLITILPAIVYEVEHDMLTEELSEELYLYFEDMETGKLDSILGDDERDHVKLDIAKCYHLVFRNK